MVDQVELRWQPIETAPRDGTDILVCVTHNVPAEEGDTRPVADDGYVWETVQWVDWRKEPFEWPIWRDRIDIPFPPSHWQPLPAPPHPNNTGEV